VAEPPEGHAIGSTIDDGRVPIPAWLVEDARRFAESGTQAAMPRRAVLRVRSSRLMGERLRWWGMWYVGSLAG